MAASAVDYEDPDDWELVNDDGFVYKRKKRLLDLSATSSSVTPLPDPALVSKHRRQRKKRALLELRDKYFKEITQWELLSNSFKEMTENAQPEPLKPQELLLTTSFDRPSSSKDNYSSNSTCRRLVDDLLSQVEAQEAIIGNIANLCDGAEALCCAQEERLKQQFTDLPIWELSPSDIVEALCED